MSTEQPLSPELQAAVERDQAIRVVANKLREGRPDLPYITAMIMAGDLISYNRAAEGLASGVPFQDCYVWVGSYARFGFAIDALDHGYITPNELFPMLPDLWSFADPDDSDPRFLRVWKQAKVWNNNKYLRGGAPLPRPTKLFVYRGQDEGEYTPNGISWTLDKEIAQKFARGAALRVSNRRGVLIAGRVERRSVLGYMTDRGESEVIVDPLDVDFIGAATI